MAKRRSPVKICATTIFYRESPEMMVEMIASVAQFADALVCVDGAISVFPGALDAPASPIELSTAIIEAAAAADLPLLLHRPRVAFATEMDKRNMSLDLARAALGHDEKAWIAVIDADLLVTTALPSLRGALTDTDEIAATYELIDGVTGRATQMRGMYRALSSLRYGESHFILRAKRGREVVFVWAGDIRRVPQVPALDAGPWLKLEHRHHLRESARIEDRTTYYKLRDLAKLEDLTPLLHSIPSAVLRQGQAHHRRVPKSWPPLADLAFDDHARTFGAAAAAAERRKQAASARAKKSKTR